MLSVERAILLARQARAAHALGYLAEALRLGGIRDHILSRLQPSELEAYHAWAADAIAIVDLSLFGVARTPSRMAS
jgi:hypothetical protein